MSGTNIHIRDNATEIIEEEWDFQPTNVPRNQNYAVLSIVAPTGTNQKCDQFGIKLYACFASLEDANKYAGDLQKQSDAFDYFTIEMREWARLPPEVERLDDIHYQESQMQDLKRKYINMREAKQQMLKERLFTSSPLNPVLETPDS